MLIRKHTDGEEPPLNCCVFCLGTDEPIEPMEVPDIRCFSCDDAKNRHSIQKHFPGCKFMRCAKCKENPHPYEEGIILNQWIATERIS